MAGRGRFDPARHPRDKFGRFTKSRTVKASAKDKAAARSALEGFTPKQTGDGRAYLAGIQPEGQRKVVADFTLDAREINQDLRAGHADAAGVAPMDAAMAPLPDDVVLSRTVPQAAFGGLDVNELAGMKVRDAGFTSTQLGTAPATADVRMHIAAPAGTRAVVNPDTGEVILDRDLEMVVAKVETNPAGGHDMFLTVLPKTTATTDGPPLEGADKVRSDLMKLKVADLRAQMRERGLKPGKMRKSEMVDALSADETGADEGSPAPFEERIAGAAVDQAVLEAAPFSLTRPETHARPGNRKGLGPASREALLAYQDADFRPINNALRDADSPTGRQAGERDEQIDRWISSLDAATTGSSLARDAVTWRGVRRAQTMFGDRLNGDMTGMQWRESAYVSTSASRDIAEQFASANGGIRMRVLVPAGTGAVQVSSYVTGGGVLDEAELLLERGLTMHVVADRGFDEHGIRDLDVEVLPSGAA